MIDNPNIVYGRLSESVHISGYSLERALSEFEFLLTDNRWKQVGNGFNDINDFLATISFKEFKIVADTRKSIATKLAALQASQRATARMIGVTPMTITRDLNIVTNVTNDKINSIDNESLTNSIVTNVTPYNTHTENAENASKSPSKSWFDIDPGKLVKQQINEVKREEKIEQQQQKFDELKSKELLQITDNYDVIIIDPPWEMEKIKRDVAPMQVGFDYPTMSIDDIKLFDLPAATNCHVFMWITHKHLPHGFDIFKEWGVKYTCCFVWHKNGGFQPFGLPQFNCEFVLYGRIGDPKFFDLSNFFTCFNANRTGHSEKPDCFYETIKRVTVGKRIDIFNRRDIDGFDKWGNEA